jgi:anthranilate phosphoribosyltransferase
VKEGIELARESINSKKAKEKLELLKEYSLRK